MNMKMSWYLKQLKHYLDAYECPITAVLALEDFLCEEKWSAVHLPLHTVTSQFLLKKGWQSLLQPC